MRSAVRSTISFLLVLCVAFLLFGCAERHNSTGWVSRTGWYGSMSDTGYYYTTDYGILSYVDFKSSINVSLCQKIGCAHDDTETCEAILDSDRVLLWQDHLYYLDDNQYGTHLYRRDATGQSLATIGTLCADITEKERNISVDVVDTLIADGYLYYYASISKGIQTEEGTNYTGTQDVIRCMDLSNGKETTIVESTDSRLELFGVQGKNVLYSSLRLPEGLTDENATELLENTTTKLIRKNMKTGEEKQLFEKRRSEYGSSIAFDGGKLYYLYYEGDERCNVVYDVDSSKETRLSAGWLSVISNRYALVRDRDFNYVLLDVENDIRLPVSLDNARLAVQCASSLGVILNRTDRTTEEGVGKFRRMAFVPLVALEDGIQESDLIVFYQISIG